MNMHERTAQLTAQPPQIRHLLETIVTSFIRWDILVALNEDRSSAPMSLESLARFLGREPAHLIPELGALVSLGMVERRQADNHTYYQLHSDQWPVVDQFVNMCENPDFRLLVIGRIWDNMETDADDMPAPATEEYDDGGDV